jgi:sorting nexin-3/12
LREFTVRRRFSDFEWLRSKIEQNLKITTPTLPEKAWHRQLPFSKETIFDNNFIEDRQRALDLFINKISEHPLVQTNKMWIAFLEEEQFYKNNF